MALTSMFDLKGGELSGPVTVENLSNGKAVCLMQGEDMVTLSRADMLELVRQLAARGWPLAAPR
jgi:hypothetical protein